MVKIQNLAKQDRPREKLIANGAKKLSTTELLQIIIGSGIKGADVTQISKNLKRLIDINGYDLSLVQLQTIKGISAATAAKLQAIFELVRRNTSTDIKVFSAADAVIHVPDQRTASQEHLITLSLNGANELIKKRVVSIGTLNASLVHPREVFAEPLTDRAASIIVIHNHPSGTLEPSDADKAITQRLKDAGRLLGINLLDHVIITNTSHYSFADSGLL